MTYYPEQYSYFGKAKPPVVIPERKGPFTCAECGRSGWGPPNSVVHPGKCRLEHTRKTALRNAERKRAKAAC